MEKRKKAVYLEGVSHVTKTIPYSAYKSSFEAGDGEALYLHWHPETEIFYLDRGRLDFIIEDIRYPMREGEAILVPPNLLHMAKAVTDDGADVREAERRPEEAGGGKAGMREKARLEGRFYALVFSADLIAVPTEPAYSEYVQPVLQNPLGFCLHLDGKEPWQQEVLGDLRRIFAREEREEEAGLFTSGLIRAVWYNLYRNHFERLAGKRVSGRLEMQLQETLAYLHGHYQEELTLQMLADIAHMSEGQLCRSFKRLTGNTPFSYLKRYRLLKSCACLAETDKKISEVCMLCGFNNISYFNREFLKMMKVKPSAYRERCRKAGQNREAQSRP